MQKTVWRPLFLSLAISLTTPLPGVAAQEVAESGLKNLPFRSIGPAVMGGRIDDVAVDPRDKSVIYVGAASGGLWKTTNRGVTWDPIFNEAEVASIGDIAIAPSNPNIIWVGTGEPNNVVIRDGQGQVVRTIKSTGDAGFKRVIWDLRVAAPAGDRLKLPRIVK